MRNFKIRDFEIFDIMKPFSFSLGFSFSESLSITVFLQHVKSLPMSARLSLSKKTPNLKVLTKTACIFITTDVLTVSKLLTLSFLLSLNYADNYTSE